MSGADFADELALEDARAIRFLRLELEAMGAREQLSRILSRIHWIAEELARTEDEEMIGWAEALHVGIGEDGTVVGLLGDLGSVAERLPERAPRSAFRDQREEPTP